MEGEVRYGAVIVAAGLSSRMEKFKPMLPVGEESIIQRTVRMMKEAGADPIVVVTGYRRELLENHLKDAGVALLYNQHYASTRMFDSVVLGLQALAGKCDRVLIAPGDVPLVKHDTIQILKAGKGAFVRPVCRRKPGHPVMIDSKRIPAIIGYRGSDGLRGAVESLKIPVEEIQVDDEGTIMDVDTKKDYEELLRQNVRLTGKPGKLRMEMKALLGTDEMFFGADSAILLEMISITGTISAACRAMHISYTKGWKMINMLEEKFRIKILERSIGGLEGGSSELTMEGKRLLQAYNGMMQELEHDGQRIFEKYFGKQENGW